MVNVLGSLLTSIGEPYANTAIYINPIINDTKLVGASAEYVTDDSGAYTFTLTEGEYELHILYDDTKEFTGNIVVDSGLPPQVSLEELLEYAGIIEPVEFNSPYVTWEDLFNDLRYSEDTVTKEISKSLLDNEDQTYHTHTKRTLSNDLIASHRAEDIVKLKSESVSNTEEKYVYSDTGSNEYGYAGSHISNSNQSIESESYIDSKGEVTDVTHLVDQDKSITKNASITPSKSTHEVSLAKGDTLSSAKSTLSDTESTAKTSNMLDTKAGITQSTGAYFQLMGNEEYRVVSSSAMNIDSLNTGSVITSRDLVEDEYSQISYRDYYEYTVASKTGSTTITNDGVVTAKLEEVDLYKVGETLTVDTVNNEVTISGKLTIAKANIPDLQDGKTVYDEYRYFSYDEPDRDLWHTVYEDGDVYRISRRVTEVGDTREYGQWSQPARLTGRDGEDGDSLYYEYQYAYALPDGSVDNASWHNPPMVDGDQWRRERVVNKGVPDEWSTEARIIGADGGDGNGSRLEVEYAADATGGAAGWHTNFSEGDYWRRERLVTIFPDGSEEEAPWQIAKLIPEENVDYGYRNATVNIYKASSTGTPAEPSGTLTYDFLTGTLSGNLEGWSQTIPNTSNLVYIATAVVWSISPQDDIPSNEWVVTQLTGSDGLTSAAVMLYKVASSRPSTPSNYLTYTFSTGLVSGSMSGWSNSIPTNTAEEGQVWVTHNIALGSGSTDSLSPYDWSTAQVMVKNGKNGKNGSDGERGYQGEHGSGSYVYPATASKAYIQGLSDSQHTSYFTSISGRSPQDSDILSYVNEDPNTGYRLDFLYDGASWTEFVSVIDGDQIVHGTVAAHHLKSASVTTDKLDAGAVNGDKISSTSTIIAGSGWHTAGMNGLDSGIYTNHRFWAGSDTPSEAEFRVLRDGSLHASNAYITGKITATSGTFAGTVSTGSIIAGVSLKDSVYTSRSLQTLAVASGTTSYVAGTTPALGGIHWLSGSRLYGVNHGSGNIGNRVRSIHTYIKVTASCQLDHYFTVWYRIGSGSETVLMTGTEGAGGYGSITLTKILYIQVPQNSYIEFGVAGTTSSGTAKSGSDLYNPTVTAEAFNW